MKKMITLLTMALLATGLSAGCDKDDEPILTQKDWSGTTDYFAPTDAPSFDTYYKPHAGYVGDPMPFYDPAAGDFKVLYLQDYRPNQAATYHPIWGVSTPDGGSYTSVGELIPCGGAAEQDAAIGTGCTVYNPADKLYYTFYTGNKYRPSASECGQAVQYATSPDFRTWTKNRTFRLTGPQDGYSRNDFRDPFVFQAEDGIYHMLIATTRDGKGVLAEYTSPDLKEWQHAGVFMTMLWDRFYECPDVFRMGDWWYLIYSEKHAAIRKVQYFKGRTLDELKASTANDTPRWPDDREGVLDSRGFYAGKTASDGTTRYIWGWCPTREGGDNTAVGAYPAEPAWAGSLVAHRLVQHEDGTLTLGPVAGIDRKFMAVSPLRAMGGSEAGVTESGTGYTLSGDSYVLFNRLGVHNRISFKVTCGDPSDRFGISFGRGSDSKKYYTLVVNPESATRRKINFEEEGEDGKGFIDGIDGYLFDAPADGVYDVTIYTDNSVLTLYIDGVAAYTNRIYGIQKNCWSINSYGGTIRIDDPQVRCY